MIIREAGPEDNDALIRLESRVSQGNNISIKFLKKDYLFKSRQFEKSLVLVAEDSGEIIGTVGAGIKTVTLNGESVKVASVFDLRLLPEYRLQVHKAYLRAIERLESWVKEQGAVLSYGFVKADNKKALRTMYARGYKIMSKMSYRIMPVFKEYKLLLNNFENPSEKLYKLINSEHKKKDLFFTRIPGADPVPVQNIYIEKESSYAACRIWDVSEIKKIVITDLPRYLKMLSRISGCISRFVPLPRFPEIGEEIKYWFAVDVISSGPERKKLLKQIFKKVNNLAYNKGVFSVMIPEDSSRIYKGDLPGLINPGFRFYILARFFNRSFENRFQSVDFDPRDF